MFRMLIAVLLLVATTARAETALDVYLDGTDRHLSVLAVNPNGERAQCNLPSPGGCRLTLSPGELRLNLKSDDQTLEKLLTVPNDHLGLKVTYQTPNMGYVGLGLLGGGVVATVLTVLSFTQIGGGSDADVNNSVAFAFLGLLTGVAAVALFVTGGVLTGIGFGRAGLKADLTPLDEVPVYAPSSAPPAAVTPPPVIVPPPPVPWEGARSDQ